jgi:hypothetical protein
VAGPRDFLFYKTVQTGSGAHSVFYSVGTGVPSCGKDGRGAKLSTHLHLVPRLRMSVAIPLLLYLLTPWSRDLLENLTGSQLLKKFPAFYGTRRFITAVTSARHLSLT